MLTPDRRRVMAGALLRARQAGRSLHLAAWSLMCLLGLALLGGCATEGPTVQRPTPTRLPAFTATPRSQPSPAAALLDPPPTDCPTSQPPQTITVTNQFGIQGTGKLLGNAPVWITDYSYPATPLHLNAGGYTQWPQWKVVWEVGPDYTQPVQLQVRNLRTGELAWWGSQPNTWVGHVFRLDPNQPDSNGPGWYHGYHSGYPGTLAGKWNEWGSAFLITRAGCYALEVTWPTGQWSILFAAGR